MLKNRNNNKCIKRRKKQKNETKKKKRHGAMFKHLNKTDVTELCQCSCDNF